MVVVSSQRKTAYVMEGQHQGMDRPLIVVIASHHRRQKSVGNHHSGVVCWSTPTNDAQASQELVR